MSQSKSNQTPVVRFLGQDAGRGGPFALLGLPHTISSDAVINRAVQQRLRQIDCHPHRGTPDASEVRLAIHSAASQLRDPSLREHLMRRWPEGTPIDMPKAWATRKATQKLTPSLMRRARMIVGSSGGWNSTARRRLAHLARMNRLGALEIIKALGRGMTVVGPCLNSPLGQAVVGDGWGRTRSSACSGAVSSSPCCSDPVMRPFPPRRAQRR